MARNPYEEYPDGPEGSPGGPAPPGPVPEDPFAVALTALYQQYYHRNPTVEEIAGHRGNPGGLPAVEEMFKQLFPPATTNPTTPTPPPTPPPTGGPPPSTQFPPFSEPWTPPPGAPIPGAPEFDAPKYTPPPAFSFRDFVAPTAETALNEPGYQFRVGQGRDILEHGAAARGVLNTGMTLKDILDYGQNAASQEYQNVYNREAGTYSMNRNNAVDQYNTNYKTQFYDPYTFAYKGALDAFNPRFEAWRTTAGMTERANEFDTNTSFSAWQERYRHFIDEQRDRWNRAYQASTA